MALIAKSSDDTIMICYAGRTPLISGEVGKGHFWVVGNSRHGLYSRVEGRGLLRGWG